MGMIPICPGCRTDDASMRGDLNYPFADHDHSCARGYPRKRRRRAYIYEETTILAISSHPRYDEVG